MIGNLCNKKNCNSGRLWPFGFWPLDLNLLKKSETFVEPVEQSYQPKCRQYIFTLKIVQINTFLYKAHNKTYISKPKSFKFKDYSHRLQIIVQHRRFHAEKFDDLDTIRDNIWAK